MFNPSIAYPMQNTAKAWMMPRELYFSLLRNPGVISNRASALTFLQQQLEECATKDVSMPDEINKLEDWIVESSKEVGHQYQQYLQLRKEGAPRQYFNSKAHALNFIKSVAPTKMVDGAWLYGLVKHWNDSSFSDLLDIYLEELGNGEEENNHVAIYRKLIRTHGCEQWETLDDRYFIQGAIQLALASHADQFLPEIIGFNLAYEQLPLHLLITAAELNELNIDPYYFTLHITIDNALSGHALKAVKAVREIASTFSDQREFMRRLRNGARLSNGGLGSLEIIHTFNLEQELLQIFREKASVGQFMHHSHCRIGGQTLQEWLSSPHEMPALLQSLQDHGWITRHQDPQSSRFCKLVDGHQGLMFGVFTAYEKQVLYDWIAGDYLEQLPKRERLGESWRVRKRQMHAECHSVNNPAEASNIIPLARSSTTAPSNEQILFNQQVRSITDKEVLMRLLAAWISPAMHHYPTGLAATRMFKAEWMN
ncbi:iron-containing redox enzyme family protein [Methylobacillus gramineus]|uniref:iron-containing redox enzyme family protein n=1 Tax=Methylobacillus gramineus TaxID=755169 RepID=UPI001CFFC05B|nr:iron-containing redox enzyme family protein [Methylobacillus gramineus]MCB5184997.1 iron-containing redox enzyme family protein [Methylobacillus gramineus]